MFTIRSLKVAAKDIPDPLWAFTAEGDGPKKFTKQVCFYRLVGMDRGDNEYIEAIRQIDKIFREEQPDTPYLRLHQLKAISQANELQEYTRIYDGWSALEGAPPEARFAYRFPVSFGDDMMEWTMKQAFGKTLEVYQRETDNTTASMARNFGVKLLCWADTYLPKLFRPAEKNISVFPKLVYTGSIKKQESLFLYFLALMGCDILYMNPEGDFTAPYQSVIQFSKLHTLGPNRPGGLTIPPPEAPVPPAKPAPVRQEQAPPAIKSVAAAANAQSAALQPASTPAHTNPPPAEADSELSYVELANLSPSVVMIKVYDNAETCFKTGSGVVVGSKGYVLTNHHVINGGHHYSLRFENEQEEYFTETLVKYHPNYDLALLRVDKPCRAIPVLPEEKQLVRGQRVVAIGSPLGLFNSISDGIIAGFRQIDDKSMVQVTAPVSSGSSGGALLDMYGRLIGLITAGYDSGQNLNLAVDYTTIWMFARNYLS